MGLRWNKIQVLPWFASTDTHGGAPNPPNDAVGPVRSAPVGTLPFGAGGSRGTPECAAAVLNALPNNKN